MSERFIPTPKEPLSKTYFSVYCIDEGRFIYESSGINRQIEGIIARESAIGHSRQLNHRVVIFEQGKKIS